jgi:hypothetical protein
MQAAHARDLRRVLIVSPHFPPINAPDMHRVRISLPHLRDFGWDPVVLAVDPASVEGIQDPLLAASVPADVPVSRVRALSTSWTRRLGIGNLGLRALPRLAGAGATLIRQHRIDCVYFSTTMFPAMTLGRYWKRRFGVPYVLDIQDPWLSTYHEEHPEAPRPPKYRLAHRLDALMEPWTMRQVDGVIAVSQAYIDVLRRRYPWLSADRTLTLPFGAADADFDLLADHRVTQTVFSPGDGALHGVYVGRGGHDLAPALRVVFEALQRLRAGTGSAATRVQLHFVGTDYAMGDRARQTVAPVAEAMGLADVVHEQTARVPYFEALQLLRDADFLLIVGSNDAQYTASKLYPYILAKRPLLAVVHRQSSVATVMRATGAGAVVTIDEATPAQQSVADCERALGALLSRLPFVPETDWAAFAPYTAREMTRRQCALFDRVVGR